MKHLSQIIMVALLSLVPYLGFSGGSSLPFKRSIKEVIPHPEYGKENIPKGLKTKIKIEYEKKAGQMVLKHKRIEKYNKAGRLVETQSHSEPNVAYPKGHSVKYIYKYDDKVKQMTMLEYDSTGDTLTGKYIYKYDEKGNQIEQAVYDADGNLGLKHTHKYDQAGNIIEYTSSIHGILSSKGACKYDAKGNLIEVISCKGDGTIFYKYAYKYDDKDNIVEAVLDYDEDNLDKKISYKNKYDAKGNLVEVTGYDEDGSLDFKDSFKYDAKGNLIESCHYGTKGRWTTKQTYKYDAKGNLIEEAYYSTAGKIPDTQTTYEYEFYPQGEGNK